MSRESATLVGYGPKTDKSTKVSLVRHKIEPRELCAAKYNPEKTVDAEIRHRIETSLPRMFQNSLICAGDVLSSRFGACGGDSGAPLIQYETDINTFEKTVIIIQHYHNPTPH